jgi:hypothetical protein
MGNVQIYDNNINMYPHNSIASNVITVVQYSRLNPSSLPLNKANRETFL